jgi:DNA topoisomerase-1
MVNDYIRSLAKEDFTAKDFRTWCGTVTALTTIIENEFDEDMGSKKKTIAVLDKVAALLGNTRTVCKKYYVHPSLLELFETNKLDKWLTKKNNDDGPNNGLLPTEKILIRILESL